MLPDIPEGEKFPPRVVENAVYYNPDTVFHGIERQIPQIPHCFLDGGQ